MLRITAHDNTGSLTFQLEGKLAGAWVREMEDCWQRTLAGQSRPIIRLDLTGVTFIDAAGKAFLAARHAEGAELVASGCLMRAIVAEITNAAVPDCGCPEAGGLSPPPPPSGGEKDSANQTELQQEQSQRIPEVD